MAGWNPTVRPEALPRVSGAQGNPAGSPGGTPGGPPAAAGAKGWAGKNRNTLLAAGAAGVVLLAVVMKSRAGASATPDATAAGTYTTNPQNLAAYDSTSSDVYNALQPQLEAIQRLLNEWGVDKGASSTTPVSGTPTDTPTTSVPVKVPTGTVLPDLGPSPVVAADLAKSPVGTALYQNTGMLPPSDRGATNSQAQADYGKAYEQQWEKLYGLKQ